MFITSDIFQEIEVSFEFSEMALIYEYLQSIR